MKYYTNFSIILIVLLSACNIANNNFIEPRQYGIKFEISNRTDQEFEHTQVIIGGIDENNEFIEIDSYALPKIKIGLQQVLSGYDDIRWKPDFETIRTIGEGKAFFNFQFMDKDANFIEFVNNPDEYLHIDLHRHQEVYDENGNVKLYFEDDDDEYDINGDLVTGWIAAMLFTKEESDLSEKSEE